MYDLYPGTCGCLGTGAGFPVFGLLSRRGFGPAADFGFDDVEPGFGSGTGSGAGFWTGAAGFGDCGADNGAEAGAGAL